MSQFVWPPVTASNPSVGATGTTAPASATEIAGVNAGNLVPVSVDSSGNVNVNIQGTAPVSGTVTANQGTAGASSWPVSASQSGTWTATVTQATGTNLHTVVDSSALPIGASTSALQTSGNTLLTTIASNQTNGTQVTAINNFPATQPVSGTVTVAQATAANLNATVTGTVAATQSGTWNITNVSGTVSLPTGASTAANQATEITSLASLVTNTNESTTSAITSVAGSSSSVSLLALNTSRKMATFYNDSTAILYLKLGATASTTSYTVQLVAGAYYELPWKSYTGAIDGIWASATGSVRITELT